MHGMIFYINKNDNQLLLEWGSVIPPSINCICTYQIDNFRNNQGLRGYYRPLLGVVKWICFKS